MDRRPLALASGAFLLFALATLIMTWSTDAMLGSGAGAFSPSPSISITVSSTGPCSTTPASAARRYFPLVFVLNAWLIRLGFSPVIAGRTIAVVGAVALIWAASARPRGTRCPSPVGVRRRATDA